MSRIAVLLVVLGVGCSDARVGEPAPAPASVAPAPGVGDAGRVSAGDPELAVDADDRACGSDGECTAILTRCSMCAGACTGVRVDRAGRYDGRLDCSQYRGEVCNYDCRPSFAIEAPRCVAGRCESVRVR